MFVACVVTLCIAGAAAAPSPTTLQDVLVASQQAFAAGDFARAASSLRTAQRMAPDIRAVYYNLGTALSRSGDPESAVVTYRNGCRRFPNDPAMHSSLCKAVNSLLNDRQQLGARLPMGRQEMARMCRLAAEMLPDDLDVLTAYGAVLGYNNEAREAAGVFRRMIIQFGGRLDPPALSNAHMNLALTLLNTGGYDEAWTNADQALRLERSPDRLRMAALIRSFCFAGDRLARSLADEALTMATAGTPSHPTYCPSGRWRISRRWGNDAKRNNDIVVTVLGENVHLVFIKKGFISGTGAITTECTVHTGGRQATSVDQHRLSHLATDTVQIVDAPLASVLDFFVGNHYHAVIEVLPKLLLLHRYVLSRPEYRDVRLLLPRQGLSSVIDEAVEMIPSCAPRSSCDVPTTPATRR